MADNTRRRFGEAPVVPQDVARDMSSLQKQIEELDKQLEGADGQEKEQLDKALEDVAENTKRQIRDGVASVASSFRQKCENQLTNLDKRQEVFTRHNRNELGRHQENIFKTNKVFREVSRYLREDWPKVFKSLMSKHPKGRVEEELSLIGKEKSIMQPYRALVRWKELSPDEFSLEKLVEVLKDSGFTEASEKARTIMGEKGGYISDPSSLDSLPQVQSSRVAEILEKAGQQTQGSSDEPGARRSSGESAGASNTTSTSGPVNNRKLFLLSKKVGDKWQQLGQCLGVPGSEMRDIKALVNGDSQQCAFQTLYKWREDANGSDEDMSNQLAKALSSLGLSEQAKDFESS